MTSAQWIGRAIQLAREDEGISQTELARRTGIDQVYVSRTERGVHEPRRSTVEKYAKAFDCEVEDFLPEGS